MTFRVTSFALFSLLFSVWTFAQAMRNDQCPVGSWCNLEGDTELNTQLLRSSFRGDFAETKRLINAGASVNARPKEGLRGAGGSAVCIAIQTSIGHPATSSYTAAYRSVVKLLVDHGADAHGCFLASVNDVEIVKLALIHGADPKEGDAIVPAMAMWYWDIKHWNAVIKLLLEAGADPNVKDPTGHNMLFQIPRPTSGNSKVRISESDTAQLFKLFIEHGTRINDTAAYIGDRECGHPVAMLGGVQSCWALNEDKLGCHVPLVPCAPERLKTFDSGITPLMNAAGWLMKSEFLVKLLLSSGADPTLKNAEGCTALDLAGTPAIHKLLAESMRSKIGGIATELPSSTCKPIPATFAFKLSTSVDSKVKAPQPLTLDKIDLLCYRGPGAWRTALDHKVSTAFGDKQILSIKIVDLAKLLTPRSTAEITREILFSIALWRRMCTQCNLANAAVVEIGGKTYVDERLLGIVQSFDFDNSNVGGKSLLDPSLPPNVNTLAGLYGDARLGQMVPLAEFREASPTDPTIQHLCSATRNKSPIEFIGIREAFQCGNERKPETASLQIKILDGPPTNCGHSKAVVGCESSDSNIELNAHEYTFVEHNTSKLLFGIGQYTVDLQVLILHETGHWAGIYAHLTSPRNIMSAYLDECVCIDQTVIDQLGRSTLGVHRNRPFALLYKRPDGSTMNDH